MIKYEDLKVGSQIVFKTPLAEDKKLHAVCISENGIALDFLAELGSLHITKEDFEETTTNFEIEIIDENHPQWQKVDNRVFNFFNKLNELERKQNNGEADDNDDFLSLLEALGDEFDENLFK